MPRCLARKGRKNMKTFKFLGGPWHGTKQQLAGEARPFVVVNVAGQQRAATYVYYSPTSSYVIAAYHQVEKAAA